MQIKLEVEDVGMISDGHHTFNELYDHRYALFIALMKSNPKISWLASYHDDGSMLNAEFWFIAGMHLPSGDISYHLPNYLRSNFKDSGIKELVNAPKWDGHTSRNVIHRLWNWEI